MGRFLSPKHCLLDTEAHRQPHSVLFCDRSTMSPLCRGCKSSRERDSREGLWGRGRRKVFWLSNSGVGQWTAHQIISELQHFTFFVPFPSQNHNTSPNPLFNFVICWPQEMTGRWNWETFSSRFWIFFPFRFQQHWGHTTKAKRASFIAHIYRSFLFFIGEFFLNFVLWLGPVVGWRQPAAHSRDVSVGYHQKGPGQEEPARCDESNLIHSSDSLGAEFYLWDPFHYFCVSSGPHTGLLFISWYSLAFSHQPQNHKANPQWLRGLMSTSLISPRGEK